MAIYCPWILGGCRRGGGYWLVVFWALQRQVYTVRRLVWAAVAGVCVSVAEEEVTMLEEGKLEQQEDE